MAGLGAAAYARLLGLDEVADVRFGFDHALGPQMRERSELRAVAHAALHDHAIGLDIRPFTHLGVDQHRAHVDARAGADPGAAAQAHARADFGFGCDLDAAVDARVAVNGHACLAVLFAA